MIARIYRRAADPTLLHPDEVLQFYFFPIICSSWGLRSRLHTPFPSRLWPVLIPSAFIASAGAAMHTQSCTFWSNLSLAKLAYFHDHSASGPPLLPATAFFEFALAAGLSLQGMHFHGTEGLPVSNIVLVVTGHFDRAFAVLSISQRIWSPMVHTTSMGVS